MPKWIFQLYKSKPDDVEILQEIKTKSVFKNFRFIFAMFFLIYVAYFFIFSYDYTSIEKIGNDNVKPSATPKISNFNTQISDNKNIVESRNVHDSDVNNIKDIVKNIKFTGCISYKTRVCSFKVGLSRLNIEDLNVMNIDLTIYNSHHVMLEYKKYRKHLFTEELEYKRNDVISLVKEDF